MTNRENKLNDIIAKIEPIVRYEDEPSLILGALVYWVTELIVSSDDPENVSNSICDLIRNGVKDARK